jgi:hypothetical protein
MTLSVGQLLIMIVAGAAVIALWLDFRFPGVTPKHLRQALIHVGISIVAAQLVVPVLVKTIAAAGSPIAALVAVFAVGFPSLTYCLLASIWIIKGLQSALHHH